MKSPWVPTVGPARPERRRFGPVPLHPGRGVRRVPPRSERRSSDPSDRRVGGHVRDLGRPIGGPPPPGAPRRGPVPDRGGPPRPLRPPGAAPGAGVRRAVLARGAPERHLPRRDPPRGPGPSDDPTDRRAVGGPAVRVPVPGGIRGAPPVPARPDPLPQRGGGTGVRGPGHHPVVGDRGAGGGRVRVRPGAYTSTRAATRPDRIARTSAAWSRTVWSAYWFANRVTARSKASPPPRYPLIIVGSPVRAWARARADPQSSAWPMRAFGPAPARSVESFMSRSCRR